jgi:hypothetical protein
MRQEELRKEELRQEELRQEAEGATDTALGKELPVVKSYSKWSEEKVSDE